MSVLAHCFVAYPSTPDARAEVIEGSIEDLKSGGVVDVTSWRSLAVGGRILIESVCEEIRSSDVFIADTTGLNPNVLFELGYAIAHRRRIWLLLDPHLEKAKLDFDRFQLLTTVGYCAYSNSRDITDGFYKDQPYEHLDQILYDELSTSVAQAAKRDALLYLKSEVNTEATVRIARRVSSGPLKSVIDDPKEVRVQPLSWYVQQAACSFAVVCHLLSTEYRNWELHNAKHALVAGLAYGLNKPLLVLAHAPYESPIDYRDLLRLHRTAENAEAIFDNWLLPLIEQYEKRRSQAAEYEVEARAHRELKDIAIGDPVAEFESETVPDYFVATAAYNEVAQSNHSILVGRKGSGKTATLYKLAEELGADPRNHICIVKPVDYELEGLLEVLRRAIPRAEKGFLVESFWKFLVLTELTKTVYEALLAKPNYYVRTADESQLCEFVEQYRSLITPEFSARLEEVVNRLLELKIDGRGGEEGRLRISERLHSEMIGKLRSLLGRVLSLRAKVVILVDNLDKTWTESADLEILSEFLYSLLGISVRIARDFARDASNLTPIKLVFTLFLRSDIHVAMIQFAKERDKLPVKRLLWEDHELLCRVVEQRFVSSGADVSRPEEIWEKYFAGSVRGTTVRDYLMRVILPRPRDLIYLVKASLQFAINRGHARIEEKDVLSGEMQYSRFALDSLIVEAAPRIRIIEDFLLDLVRGPDIVTEKAIQETVLATGLDPEGVDLLVDTLGELTFFGYEVAPGRFEFMYELESASKILAMARKTADLANGGTRRFYVHPAYHAYLELQNVSGDPEQLKIDI
jgi:hypothetical protein